MNNNFTINAFNVAGDSISDFSDSISLIIQTKDNPHGDSLIGRDTCCFGDTIKLTVSLPQYLCPTNGSLRLFRDDDGDVSFYKLKPLKKETKEHTDSVWHIALDTSVICAKEENSGLFYYRFEFDTVHGHCFFSKAPSSLQPILRFQDENIASFQLTVIQPDSDTPTWMQGGVMYHIFVDRFAKGEETIHRQKAHIPDRDDAVYNTDWYNGIPQHAKFPGGEVKNNEFFGGTLWGVAEKLPYLESLGVTTLYLSPIFRAYSNHKYDTGDYEEIDPSFGGEKAFDCLIRKAKQSGIRIICDGVFNHTGDDSKYFNRYGHYPDNGAYNSDNSPYKDWYRFRDAKSKDKYDCWWGVKVLPALKSDEPSMREYFCGENGIIHRWMQKGVYGWRLDVADELNDLFLNDLHDRVRKENTEGLIIGEVWEDASFKIAYNKRRKYFRGHQLDSVMNYPFRNGILSYLKSGDASELIETVKEIVSHYPAKAVHNLMNLLGTHDTERILTILAGEPTGDRDNDELAQIKMSPSQRIYGLYLLKIAAIIQFTLPGVPCIYYGDEAGMEGYRDPFNRYPFPWGKEENELTDFYRLLGKIRKTYHSVYAKGDIVFQESDMSAQHGVLIYSRTYAEESIMTIVNLGNTDYTLNVFFSTPLITNNITCNNNKEKSVMSKEDSITVPAGCAVLVKKTAGKY